MPYYCFEDVRGDGNVRLQSARCRHCRRGVEREAQSLAGSVYTSWHGPYEAYEHAYAEAERMGLAAAHCGECLPPGAPA